MFWFRVMFWTLLIAIVINFDVETRFWLVIGWLAFGGAIAFVGRLGMWAVFYFGSKGKLKVRIEYPDEKE